MSCAGKLAIAASLALVFAALPARAEDVPRAVHSPTGPACLDQKERRAEIESGRLIRLSAAIRAVHSRVPGTIVRARLCRGRDGLVYVLTVLGHDGKVTRIAVDAIKGTFVGGL